MTSRTLRVAREAARMSHSRGFGLSGRLIDAVTSARSVLGDRGPVVRSLGNGDATAEATVRLLEEAWALLEAHGTTYAQWLRRCVRRIVVAHVFRSRASFHFASRSVFLRSDTADAHDALGLAAILAHESSHARINETLGSLLLVGKTRARVEFRCVSNQLHLLSAVDGHHYLVNWSISMLQRYRLE